MEKTEHKKILLVENNSKHIQAVAAVLMPEGYALSFAMKVEEALEQIQKQTYNMILIDSDLPYHGAFDIVTQMQRIGLNCDTPVLFFVTDVNSTFVEDIFSAGVVDYIHKPFVSQELLMRVRTHLHYEVLKNPAKIEAKSEIAQAVEDTIELKFANIIEKNEDTAFSQQEIIFQLCSLMEKRSNEEDTHVRRIADVSYTLGILSGMNEDEAMLLKMAAPMHDIGNLSIPDKILHKPDKLSMEEFERVEEHTILGYKMLKDSSDPILKLASMIAWQHHEKFNGSGYPNGLKGEEIDFRARIVALADVFDTLSDDRVYGKAWSDEEIERYIAGERGQHFDPSLVEIFFKHKERFFALRSKSKLS